MHILKNLNCNFYEIKSLTPLHDFYQVFTFKNIVRQLVTELEDSHSPFENNFSCKYASLDISYQISPVYLTVCYKQNDTICSRDGEEHVRQNDTQITRYQIYTGKLFICMMVYRNLLQVYTFLCRTFIL